jgi:hypothetical protein
MDFAIVKFVEEKDAVAVVPTTWINDQGCYWPPPGTDVIKFVKKSNPPDPSTWKLCPIQVSKYFGTTLNFLHFIINIFPQLIVFSFR